MHSGRLSVISRKQDPDCLQPLNCGRLLPAVALVMDGDRSGETPRGATGNGDAGHIFGWANGAKDSGAGRRPGGASQPPVPAVQPSKSVITATPGAVGPSKAASSVEAAERGTWRATIGVTSSRPVSISDRSEG